MELGDVEPCRIKVFNTSALGLPLRVSLGESALGLPLAGDLSKSGDLSFIIRLGGVTCNFSLSNTIGLDRFGVRNMI